MRIHNIIFTAFLMVVLLGVAEAEVKDLLVVKEEIKQKVDVRGEKVVFSTIEDYENEQSLAGIEKCFDDDEKKMFGRVVNRKINILNIQQERFSFNIAEIHKPQLFLLYSSLKVDC